MEKYSKLHKTVLEGSELLVCNSTEATEEGNRFALYGKISLSWV